MAVPILVVASIALAQNPPDKKASDKPAEKTEPKKQSLEELLALALQHSPEVQVAEAKLKEAEALLRQTKLQIAQRVIEVRNKADEQQQALETADAEWKRIAQMVKSGVVSTTESAKVQAQVQALKARIAELESSMSALTGRLPALNRVEGGAEAPALFRAIGTVSGGGSGTRVGLSGIGGGPLPEQPRHWPRAPMAQKMAKALDQPMSKIEKLENIQFKDVVDFVRQQVKDVPILAKLGPQGEENVNINFKGDLTVGAFFQVLTDTVPDLKIYVRDYGFLMTFAGSEPEDGISVIEFLQQFNKGA